MALPSRRLLPVAWLLKNIEGAGTQGATVVAMTPEQWWDHIRRALMGHAVGLAMALVVLVATGVVVAVVMRRRGADEIVGATERIFPRVWYGLLALVLGLFGVLAYMNNR